MKGHVAGKAPIPVKVEAGKGYFWCSCGLSKNQPFCDGSHKGGALAPVKYVPETTRMVFFCGCKQSAKPPFCDGSHARL